jgi:type I restriction enzyme S subunit
MASEWKVWEISELIACGLLDVGDGYRAKNDELGTSGLPFARAGNINGGFNFSAADRFPAANLSKVGNKVSRPADVVFTSKGTVGRFAFVAPRTEQFVYSPQLCYWRSLSHKAINPRFLYYWMQSAECLDQLSYLKSQTDMADYVSLRDQRKMSISVPDPSVQEAVAGVLTPIDDRIAMLMGTSETLESVSQAIFKSWFVDFDPVRAKAEGREPEGMDAATTAPFPSEFEHSGKGAIPRGWEIKHIKDICDRIANGGTPKRSQVPYWQDREHSWFKTGEFKDGFLFESEEMISELAVLESAAKIFPRHTVLMAIYGATIGKLGILANPAAFNQAATGMVASKNIGPWFLYLSLLNGRSWFINRGNGAAQQNISKEIVESYSHPVPTNSEILSSFHDLVSPMFERIELNQKLIRGLSSLRDSLLPRLISCKLRIPDAEKLVEAVL